MKRQEANKELLKLLSAWVEKWPEARFGQLLHTLNVVKIGEDTFQTESETTLKRALSQDAILNHDNQNRESAPLDADISSVLERVLVNWKQEDSCFYTDSRRD